MVKLRESQLVRRKSAQTQTRDGFVRSAFRPGVDAARTIRIENQAVFWRLESLKYKGFVPL
jgi:hypothetical protein